MQEETKWADQANRQREINRNIALILSLLVMSYTIICLIRILLNVLKIINGKVKRQGKPTERIQYYRDLPYKDATPGEAIFVFSKGERTSLSNSFSANILDLCLKKTLA